MGRPRLKDSYNCEVCGKSGKTHDVFKSLKYDKVLCRNHYRLLNKHGKIPNNIRSNEVVDLGDYLELILVDEKFNEISRTKIDREFLSEVSKYKWRLNNGHAMTNINNNKSMSLHVFIYKECLGNDIEDGDIIDHKNLDGLDNRIANLRLADKSKNSMNTGLHKNNKSGFKGVSWNKNRNKWRAYITVENKRIELGHYDDIYDAVKSRLKAEMKYFGEYSSDMQKELINELLQQDVN